MKRRFVLVAWTCIFSMLYMGCYSAALIDPAGPEKDVVYTDKIKGVVTKDGTKYDFDEPAKIVSNAVVGSVKIPMSPGYTLKEVTIPLSEIERVQVSQFNVVNTLLLVVGFGAIVAGIYAAILADTMTEGIESLQ